MPCSGKTWYRERYYTATDYVHISSDDVIEKVARAVNQSYSDVFEDAAKFANAFIIKTAKKAIAARKNIVWDQTNLTFKSRKKKLALFENLEYHKSIIIFPTPPLNVLKKRIEARGSAKFIPPQILENMKRSYVLPTIDEGFDVVNFLTEGDLDV